MYADSYGGIRGGIRCADQRPSYSKLNVYVQAVLRPQFVSSSAAMLEQYYGYWCVFFIWLYPGSCCEVFICYSMAKPCILWSVCIASIHSNCSLTRPPLLPVIVASLQINSLLLTQKTTCGRLARKVNALGWDTVHERQHYLFILIYLHILYTSKLTIHT